MLTNGCTGQISAVTFFAKIRKKVANKNSHGAERYVQLEEKMKLIITIFLLTLSLESFSEKIKSQHTEIASMIARSNSTGLGAAWNGVISVHPTESFSWDKDSNCEKSFVLIKSDDPHILSMLMAAQMAKKQVEFYLYDEININGIYCFINSVRVKT